MRRCGNKEHKETGHEKKKRDEIAERIENGKTRGRIKGGRFNSERLVRYFCN